MLEDMDALAVEKPVSAQAANIDLSAQINAAVEKRADETVRCVRVFGDNYRCNWWVRADHAATHSSRGLPLDGTMLRVRRSSFLTVTRTPDGLQIRGLTAAE